MFKKKEIKHIVKQPCADVELSYSGVYLRVFKTDATNNTTNLQRELTLAEAKETAAALLAAVATQKKAGFR